MKKLVIAVASIIFLSSSLISTPAYAMNFYGSWQLVKSKCYSYKADSFGNYKTLCAYKRNIYNGMSGPKTGEEWHYSTVTGKGTGWCTFY